MKRLCYIMIFIACFTFVLQVPIDVKASKLGTNKKIEYLDNGDYIETVILQEETLDSYIVPFSANKTISIKKTTSYKTKSGKILWTLTVHGKFTYTGKSSKCNSSDVSTAIQDKNWFIAESSSKKSGNCAIAKATAKRKNNGTVVETVFRTVTLTCDANGKLS